MSKTTRRDVAAEITAQLVAKLDQGVAPWVRPWAIPMPRNHATGRAYRGANVVLLWAAMDARGYRDARWLTFKQALDCDGHVRRGEKGTQIVFWRFTEIEKQDATTGETRKVTIPFARFHTVFNVEQCDGLNASAGLDAEPATLGAEVLATRAGVSVSFGGTRAFYAPDSDRIQIPAREHFASGDAFEAMLLHELVHWTGHEHRLARDLRHRFSSEAYAFEELVAELGSAFLCAHLGITGRLQHAEYLASWARVLRDDKHAIFTAARLAQEATAYLLGADSDASEKDDAGEAQAA